MKKMTKTSESGRDNPKWKATRIVHEMNERREPLLSIGRALDGTY